MPWHNWREGGRGSNSRIILCQADKMQINNFSPLKFMESSVNESSGKFSGTIRTKIEENYRIMRIHYTFIGDNGGFDKFISLSMIISVLQSLEGVSNFSAAAVYHAIIDLMFPIPAIITVHGIVTAQERSNR